jgi:hypothetical protein
MKFITPRKLAEMIADELDLNGRYGVIDKIEWVLTRKVPGILEGDIFEAESNVGAGGKEGILGAKFYPPRDSEVY